MPETRIREDLLNLGNLEFTTNSNVNIGTKTNYDVMLISNNLGRINILSNGNVIIGNYTHSAYSRGLLTITNDNNFGITLSLISNVSDRYGFIRGEARDNSGTAPYATGSIRFYRAGNWQGGITFHTTPTYDQYEIERMRITPGGAVGINTSAPTYTLHVNGSFAASSKNFDIPHPLDPENKRLVHATLEGPEYGVYYRGISQLDNGSVIIELPSYFEILTREEGRTILLTNIDGFDKLCVQTQDNKLIKDGKFIVVSDNPNSTQKFCWEVKAIRKDLEILIPEKEITNQE